MQRGTHDADQRALPRRQLGAHRFREMRDTEAFEALRDAARRRISQAVELSVQLQVLAHAHPFGEREITRREAHTLGRLTALALQIEAADRHVTRVGADNAEDHQERGGLARAVRTEERDAFTGVHEHVDPVDRARPAGSPLRGRAPRTPARRACQQRNLFAMNEHDDYRHRLVGREEDDPQQRYLDRRDIAASPRARRSPRRNSRRQSHSSRRVRRP